MKHLVRFRLRTLLLSVAVLAVCLGLWPSIYNQIVLRPDELQAELTECLEDFNAPGAVDFRGGTYYTQFGIYRIGNAELEVRTRGSGELEGFTRHQNALERDDAYWIWPPGEWVNSTDEAVQAWKREYLTEHGWRWW